MADDTRIGCEERRDIMLGAIIGGIETAASDHTG